MRAGRAAAIAALVLATCFLAGGAASAAHLEPFQGIEEPVSNPGTPEKVELGRMLFFRFS